MMKVLFSLARAAIGFVPGVNIVAPFLAKVPWPVWAALLVLGFYEGVAAAKHIPFVERIPLVGERIVGRVGNAWQRGYDQAEAEALERARIQQAEWDRQTEEAQRKQQAIAADYLAAEALRTTQERKLLEGVTDADYLCTGPVFSDGLSDRLNAIGRD